MPSSGPEWVDPVRDALRQHERDRADAAAPGAPAIRIDRFELRGMLGEGAVGVVYRAHDRQLNRDVALKILREPVGASTAVRERFQREGRVAAVVSHPNLVTVHDVGDHEGQLYLVMELVEGRPLSGVLPERRGDLRYLVGLLSKVARGVAAIHEREIVHRDLKPANILVTPAGEPKVGDFGLAHVAGSQAGLTKTGAIMGTPLYMAPEQVRGSRGEIGPPTDVYALGAILYEMLAGRPPHSGDSVTEIYGRIVSQEPVSPRRLNPSVPLDLQTVALKALEKEPARRYPSAAALGAELDRWLGGEPVLAKPPGTLRRALKSVRRHPVAGAVAVMLVIGSAAVVIQVRQRWKAEAETVEALRLLDDARPALEKAQRYLYRKDGDYGEILREVAASQRFIQAAVEKAPLLPTAHFLLGRTWEILGRDDNAEACWRETIRLKPNFATVHYHLGRLLALRFLVSLQETALDRLPPSHPLLRTAQEAAAELDVAVRGGSNQTTGAIELRVAEALASLARRDKVRIPMGEFIERYGREEGGEELYLMKGMASLDPAAEIEAYTEAIRLRSRYPMALLLRGHAQRKLGLDGPAVDDYTRALEVNPRLAAALRGRAHARLNLRDFEQAERDASAAIDLRPDDVGGHSIRGRVRLQLRNFEGAVEDGGVLIRADPADKDGYLVRFAALLALDRTEEAIIDANTALSLEPSNPDLFRNRGVAFAKIGRWEPAVRDFEAALKSAPGTWPSRDDVTRRLDIARSRLER